MTTMCQKTESDLLAEYRFGDEKAIAELFVRYHAYYLRLARGILRSEDDSQDAVQTAYYFAFRQLHAFRGNSAFKTWVARIVVNCCLARLRKPEARLNWVDFENAFPHDNRTAPHFSPPNPEQYTLQQELAAAINSAANKLPRPLREAFDLYQCSGLPLKKVAETLGVTLPAAKSRVFRANSQMRSHLRPMFRSRVDRVV